MEEKRGWDEMRGDYTHLLKKAVGVNRGGPAPGDKYFMYE